MPLGNQFNGTLLFQCQYFKGEVVYVTFKQFIHLQVNFTLKVNLFYYTIYNHFSKR